MIKVNKSYPAPAVLNKPDPTNANGINDSIYGDASVKQQLKDDQKKKCAYCERYYNGDYGAVEHFRPKRKYKIADGQPEQDGYYWLAYEWDNLLYSCSECNTSCKRTKFPLFDESKRDIAHRNIAYEQPLLVNPAFENPARFIGWKQEYAVAVGISPFDKQKGETTIRVMELNSRQDLVARRRKMYKDYLLLRATIAYMSSVSTPTFIINQLKHKEKSMKADDAEFAGMIRYQK